MILVMTPSHDWLLGCFFLFQNIRPNLDQTCGDSRQPSWDLCNLYVDWLGIDEAMGDLDRGFLHFRHDTWKFPRMMGHKEVGPDKSLGADRDFFLGLERPLLVQPIWPWL